MGNNARTFLEKFATLFNAVYLDNNVNPYLAKLARLSLVNNARMCQDKWRDKNARMFPANNARTYQSKNVAKFSGNNVTTYLGNNVGMFQNNNVEMFPSKFARMFPVNNARTYPVKSATNKLVMAVKKYLINPAQCLGFLLTLQSCYAVQKTSFISILQ